MRRKADYAPALGASGGTATLRRTPARSPQKGTESRGLPASLTARRRPLPPAASPARTWASCPCAFCARPQAHAGAGSPQRHALVPRAGGRRRDPPGVAGFRQHDRQGVEREAHGVVCVCGGWVALGGSFVLRCVLRCHGVNLGHGLCTPPRAGSPSTASLWSSLPSRAGERGEATGGAAQGDRWRLTRATTCACAAGRTHRTWWRNGRGSSTRRSSGLTPSSPPCDCPACLRAQMPRCMLHISSQRDQATAR